MKYNVHPHRASHVKIVSLFFFISIVRSFVCSFGRIATIVKFVECIKKDLLLNTFMFLHHWFHYVLSYCWLHFQTEFDKFIFPESNMVERLVCYLITHFISPLHLILIRPMIIELCIFIFFSAYAQSLERLWDKLSYNFFLYIWFHSINFVVNIFHLQIIHCTVNAPKVWCRWKFSKTKRVFLELFF